MIEIRNIKISLKIDSLPLNIAISILSNKNIPCRDHFNFISFKNQGFTFVLFKPSKNGYSHINITKITKGKDIARSGDIVKDLFKCSIAKSKIDNIVATDNLNLPLNLKNITKSKIFENIKYNSEQFPGLFVKFPVGTAIIFHSGKFVVVGCKNTADVKWISNTIYAGIQKQLMMKKKGNVCALNAA